MNEIITIKEIDIKNYRLCKHASFKPQKDLSVLIGPNGSGKTTLLKSIQLLNRLMYDDVASYASKEDRIEVDPTIIKVTLDINGKKIIHTSELYIDNDEANNDRIMYSRESWYMKDFTGSRRRVKLPASLFLGHYIHDNFIYPRHFNRSVAHKFDQYRKYYQSEQDFVNMTNKAVRKTLTKVAQFYQNITYYSASQFTNPSLCPISFEVEENEIGRRRHIIREISRQRSGHLKWLKDLYTAHVEASDNYQNFIDIIGKRGLNLVDEIYFQKIQVSNVEHNVRIGGELKTKKVVKNLIIPQIKIQDSILSPSQLSEGTFKVLGLLFYLITDKSSVLLLEEPEVCIHHGLLASLIELIKDYSQEKQIFVSTHSDYILDSLNPSSLYVLQKNQEISISSLRAFLSTTDYNALEEFLYEEGSLGEYWRMGALDH